MNNLAVTCHVVGGVGEKAARVYQKGTTNSAFVSTYAYSLLVQQKAGEALKIIEELPENPKGIPPQSPGLRAASYPGKSGWCRPTPTGLWPGVTREHNPFSRG